MRTKLPAFLLASLLFCAVQSHAEDADKLAQQGNIPVAQIPAEAMKSELRYKVLNENGRKMMSLHNSSDTDLAILLGAMKVALKSGAKLKVAFPNQPLADFKVYRQRDGKWIPLFFNQIRNQPAKGAIQIKP